MYSGCVDTEGFEPTRCADSDNHTVDWYRQRNFGSCHLRLPVEAHHEMSRNLPETQTARGPRIPSPRGFAYLKALRTQGRALELYWRRPAIAEMKHVFGRLKAFRFIVTTKSEMMGAGARSESTAGFQRGKASSSEKAGRKGGGGFSGHDEWAVRPEHLDKNVIFSVFD